MKLLSACVLFAALIVAGCSKQTAEEYMAKANVARDSSNFTLAIEQYEKLIAEHPKSALAEEAMFAVASIKNDNQHDFPASVLAYKRVYETYPDGKRAPLALFLVGYVSNNELRDLTTAKQAYESFLAKYPDHEMAASARFELANLGKRPEELLPPTQENSDPNVATQISSKTSGKKK